MTGGAWFIIPLDFHGHQHQKGEDQNGPLQMLVDKLFSQLTTVDNGPAVQNQSVLLKVTVKADPRPG